MTDTKTIADMNRDIAEFMEQPKCERCEPEPNCGHYKIGAVYYAPSNMEYHSSWAWLHEAWNKVWQQYGQIGNLTSDLTFRPQFAEPMCRALITSNLSEAHGILWESVEWIQKQKV